MVNAFLLFAQLVGLVVLAILVILVIAKISTRVLEIQDLWRSRRVLSLTIADFGVLILLVDGSAEGLKNRALVDYYGNLRSVTIGRWTLSLSGPRWFQNSSSTNT